MTEDLFSKKYNLRPTFDGLILDEIPNTTRIGVTNIIQRYFSYHNYPRYFDLYQRICLLLRQEVDIRLDGNAIGAFVNIGIQIKECKWWYVYDICQIAFDLIWKTNQANAIEFSEEIRTLFLEEGLGWSFHCGKLERVRPELVQLSINEAKTLLKDEKYKSADELFKKAFDALNLRPKPDVENAIKDAICSIESVGRVILSDPKPLLDGVVKELSKNGFIPKPLDEMILKLYAYRGNEPSVAHGSIEPSRVSLTEAEFVVSMTAAILIFIVSKKGNG